MEKLNLSDVKNHNEKAWNHCVEQGIRWSVPVSSELINKARNGDYKIFLTPKTPIPPSWVGEIKGKKVLGLASGGGQQGPLLAAAGAETTILDISGKQLEKDKEIAANENLSIKTIQSSADDLSMIQDNSIDLILNPVSNCFFQELLPVWKECNRILKTGGHLIYGFDNPISFLFDYEKANLGEFHLKYSMPFSDLSSLNETEKKRFLRIEEPLEFGHSLQSQIGDLIQSGFAITGFFEDYWDSDEPINKYYPTFINVKASKL